MSESTTYKAVHQRLVRKRGRASQHPCSACQRPAVHWAYDHADPDELTGMTNGNGPKSVHAAWSASLEHYMPMCASCHQFMDARRRNECPNGHAYTPENTYLGAGYQRCRRCNADAQARRKARNSGSPR